MKNNGHLMLIICPRCNEQGLILKKIIKQTNQEILICDECDAIWFSIEDISVKKIIDFGTYMESIFLPPLWEELE